MGGFPFLDGWDTLLVVKACITAGVLPLYVVLRWTVRRIINNHAAAHKYSESRISAAHRAVSVLGFLLFLGALAITWSINSNSFLVVSGAIMAAIGIGFFASWSILSNVTTSIIMFWRFPMRVGDRIGLLEDKSFVAVVKEFTIFFVILEDLDGNRISLPNSLTLQHIFIVYREGNPKTTEPAPLETGSGSGQEPAASRPRLSPTKPESPLRWP